MNHRSIYYRINLLLISMTLAACNEVSITTAATPSATVPPTVTISLESHSWQAQPVIAELFTSAGFTDRQYARTILPDLVLYADGRLITTHIDYATDGLEHSISEAQLAPAEVCTFLYHIETNGFFDFNLQDYHPLQVTDMGTTDISIHTWRSRDTSSYALDYMNTASQNANVPTALAMTYQYLLNFRFTNAKAYQPDKLAVFISRSTDYPQPPMLWPLATPKLADLVRGANDRHAVLLQGSEASNVYNFMSVNWTGIFTEGGTTYSVAVRPLLPLEQWPLADEWSPAPSFPVTPTTNLSCDPSMIRPLPTMDQTPTVPAHTPIPYLP